MYSFDPQLKHELSRTGCSPIFKIEIEAATIYDRTAATLRACMAPEPIEIAIGETIPNSIESITNTAQELNPLSRKFTVGGVTIGFMDDGWLRAASKKYYLTGKRLKLFMGAYLGAKKTTAFEPIGSYLIEGISPEPGRVMMNCNDFSMMMFDAEITGDFIGWNPLEIIRILLEDGQVPYELWDSAAAGSLYPDTHSGADSLKALSHYVCTRADYSPAGWGWLGYEFDHRIKKPTKILGLINELVEMCYGAFIPDAQGVYKFKNYTASASAIRDLGGDDISDFKQIATTENMINRMIVNGAAVDGGVGGNQPNSVFRIEDLNTQSFYAPAGLTPEKYIKTHTVSLPWVNAYGHANGTYYPNGGGWGGAVLTSTTDPTDTNYASKISVSNAHESGFCGTYLPGRQAYHAEYYLGTIIKGNEPSATRKLNDEFNESGSQNGRGGFLELREGDKREIIKVKKVVGFDRGAGIPGNLVHDRHFETRDPGLPAGNLSPAAATRPEYPTSAHGWNPPGGQDSPRDRVHLHRALDFEIEARGALGTTPQTFNSFAVFDITIAVDLAYQILARFTEGCPIIEITTSLSHADLELGDFVTVADPLFLDRYYDGVTSTSHVWEIIRKEIRIEDTPGIVFQLAFVRLGPGDPVSREDEPATTITTTGYVPIASPLTEIVLAGDLVVESNIRTDDTTAAGGIITAGPEGLEKFNG